MRFAELGRWDVSGFTGIGWHWPAVVIRPIREGLKRVIDEVPTNAHKRDVPIIEKISFGGELVVSEQADREGYKGRLFWARPGSLIYSKIRLKQGSVTVVSETTGDVAVSAEYPVYAIDTRTVISRYLELTLRCSAFQRMLDGLSHGGSTKTRIHPEQFEALEIPFPPLATQQAIVRRWQELGEASAAAKREAESLEREAERDFLHGLGLKAPDEIKPRKTLGLRFSDLDRWGVAVNQPAAKRDVSASSYPIRKLGSVIADLENGWSPKCLDRPATPEEWGVLKVGAVSFGVFDQDENKALPKHLEPMPRHEVKSGDLIISRANITRLVGACALVGNTRPHLMLCDKLFRVVWKQESEILSTYLDEVLKIPHLRWQIENALTGSSPTMKNISKPSLLALRLPVPPMTVQQSLVDAITSARARAANLRAESARLQALAKSETEAAILGHAPVPPARPATA